MDINNKYIIQFYERVKDKPIIFLSEYKSSKEKIKVKCKKCGYEWETLPYVLYRSGCPKCAKQIKHTIFTLKEKLSKINKNIDILSTVYINNKTPIKVKCKKCDYEWEYRPDKLQKIRCQNCDSKVKKTNKYYVDNFEFNKNLIILEDFIDYKTPIKVKCNKCNYEWRMLPSNLNKGCGCPKCINHISSYEDEIYEELKEFKIERNIRIGGKEIDLYLPEYKLGIEFHGLYWHSNKFKSKNYHKDKYLIAQEHGINLIQIFENEWINNKEIVLSIIKNKLKLNNTIYARKCKIKEVPIKDAKEFCNKNHIQGYSNSKIKIGLYYDEQLVSLITLSKNRFKNDNIYEIVRFCNKLDINVVGGFKKLLSYIKNNLNINELISFVDVRYFSGESYKDYEFLYHTDPNYYYFQRSNILYSRQQFQKHKLKSKLKKFNEDLSEYENMKLNGFFRIYDAGNLKFKLIL